MGRERQSLTVNVREVRTPRVRCETLRQSDGTEFGLQNHATGALVSFSDSDPRGPDPQFLWPRGPRDSHAAIHIVRNTEHLVEEICPAAI